MVQIKPSVPQTKITTASSSISGDHFCTSLIVSISTARKDGFDDGTSIKLFFYYRLFLCLLTFVDQFVSAILELILNFHN